LIVETKEHLTKAARIAAPLDGCLDWTGDYEMALEACRIAGTHLLNAALHIRGVTAETEDLAHSDRPPLEDVPAEVREMMAALKAIEDTRLGYTRDDRPWVEADGKRCRERFATLRAIADRMLPSGIAARRA
jgi:hypothetical protein